MKTKRKIKVIGGILFTVLVLTAGCGSASEMEKIANEVNAIISSEAVVTKKTDTEAKNTANLKISSYNRIEPLAL